MATATKTAEDALSRKREEFIAAERILERWNAGKEPSLEESALLFNVLLTRDKINAERQRVSKRLHYLRAAGTREEFDQALADYKRANKAAETRVPELTAERDRLSAEIAELQEERRVLQLTVESMADARKKLPRFAPSYMLGPGSPWGEAKRHINETDNKVMAEIEARLACIKGVLAVAYTHKIAISHVETLTKQIGGGHPDLPRLQRDNGGFLFVEDQEWRRYQNALRSEQIDLTEKLEETRRRCDEQLQRIDAELLGEMAADV